LLAEIPLDRVSISMTINSTAAILLALLSALARRRGVDPSKLRGTLQNDILKEYIARGTQRYPVGPSLDLAVDTIEYATEHLPRFHPISISGYHIREAGATAVEELAFTLANGVTYLERCRDRNLDLELVGRRLSFFFNAHNHLFEEIAKFRAARRMWAKLARERIGIQSERGCQLRFHTQTGGSTLVAEEPDNNVVRVTVQALAAILGGTQSLHTNGRDEALSLPTEESAQLALRTQQILARESGVTEVVDPLGGCPYVEDLTDRLEAEAMALIEEIDRGGGMVPAIESGAIRRRIEASAYKAQVAIESGERAPVGTDPDSPAPDSPFRLEAGVETERQERLARHRKNRDAAAVEKARARITACLRARENVVESLIEAVEAGVTLGEAASTLAEELGEYRDGG
jgi:methylmalonyl-CoA mutase N-terminal domain/subunit